MFTKIICIAVVVAVLANAAPLEESRILRYENEHNGDGYKFEYETSDGQKRNEVGSIKLLGDNEALLNVQGSYSFIGADGRTYLVNYVADENGFRALGDHLPQAPSVESNRLRAI